MERKKLLEQVRDCIRFKHYSIRTEEAYVHWCKRFILFHQKRHPSEMGAPDIERFLTHLAVNGKVSASTQNQAKSAILFLYKEVLKLELPWMDNIVNAKVPQRLPVVLTKQEVGKMLAYAHGTSGLILRLVYGTGMRIMECMRLRASPKTRAQHVCRDITPTKKPFNAPCKRHCLRPVFIKPRRPIHCVIALQLIYWKAGMTSVPCRNYSATKTSAPR